MKKYFVLPNTNGDVFEKVNGGAIPISQIPWEQEIWATIKNFDGYSVSNKGRVRNNKTGRILKPHLVGTSHTKYLRFRLCEGSSKRKDVFIHNLLEETFGE